MLSERMKGWAADAVTDIVLEDLSMSNDARFLRHACGEAAVRMMSPLLVLPAGGPPVDARQILYQLNGNYLARAR